MASITHSNLFIGFVFHCARRALTIRRVIRGETSFEAMLARLSPAGVQGALSYEQVPQRWFCFCADGCARLFPSMWKRRCLFRSLIILDWVRRIGLQTMLNVGMKLGPGRDQGHCWLSIADRPFCEPGGYLGPYGTVFHCGRDVRYWVCFGVGVTSSINADAPPQVAETGL
jgi:hypothetical protein